jgi:hypothetical protein
MQEGLRCGRCHAEAPAHDAFCQHCGAPLGGSVPVPAGNGGPGGGPYDRGAAMAGVPATTTPVLAQAVTPRPQADTVSEATRYLCVGAYLDERFANRVLKELFGQTYRAVAPSYGFDVGLVSSHCLAARHRRRMRDLILAAIGLLMILAGSVATVVAGLCWWAVGWVVGSLRDGPDGLRQAVFRLSWRTILYRIVVSWLVLSLASIFAAIISIAMLVGAATSGAATPGSAFPGAPTPTPGASPADAFIGGVIAFLVGGLITVGGWVVLYAIVLWDLVARRRLVVRDLRKAAFRARPEPGVPLTGRLRTQLERVASRQHSNVTVYSGFEPFVGAGEPLLQDWSFAMPLVAAEGHEGAVERFSVAALVDHVRRNIATMGPAENGAAPGPEGDKTLTGLSVLDHVFVHGGAVQGDRRFFPDGASAPRTSLGREEIAAIAREPHGPVRHYCAVQVRSWEGEVVTSTFFHFSADGEKLYFEGDTRVLRPVRAEYHAVDWMPDLLSLGDFFRLAAQAAAETVPLVAGSLRRIAGDLVFDLRDDRPPRDAIVDRGARISVRELGAEWDPVAFPNRFHNYFQLLDARKHLKIVERQVFAAVYEFLKDEGIDTSEFEERQNNIINNNVVQVGENNQIGATSFGAGSRATQSGTINGKGGGQKAQGAS